MIGLSGLLFAVGYFLVGIFTVLLASSRPMGKAMLLSAGIMLLIGISLCSLAPLNMNMH